MKHFLGKSRAYALGVLLLWFGTHHFAPGFEAYAFGFHSHTTSTDQAPQWSKVHPHSQHCDFCGSAGFAILTYQNTLPRAPKVEAFASSVQLALVTRVSGSHLARAPPARIARQVLSYEQEAH